VAATLELEEDEEVVAATADDEVLEETTALLVALVPASVETLLDPVGTSPARTHPVLAVRAAGHSTCTKSTVGLSAPSNQSYLQSQPGWRAVGNVAQAEADEIPPYCAPHPDEGAPHSAVQPLKIPTPPPGILMSNWLVERSDPVLVACTIIFLPAIAVLVKVSS